MAFARCPRPEQVRHRPRRQHRAASTFTAHGNDTVVRLTQTGWQSGPEWDAAYEYLASGNAQLPATLHRRFVSGPLDWEKIFGPATPKAAK